MIAITNTFAPYPPYLLPLFYDGEKNNVVLYAESDSIHVRDGVIHYIWDRHDGKNGFDVYLPLLQSYHSFNADTEFLLLYKHEDIKNVWTGKKSEVEAVNDIYFTLQWKTEMKREDLKDLLMDMRKKEKFFRTEEMKKAEKDLRAEKIMEHLNWVRNEVGNKTTPVLQ